MGSNAYYKLFARIIGAAVLVNGVLALLWVVTTVLFTPHSEEEGRPVEVLLFTLLLTLPFLAVALWPLVRRASPQDLEREKLKAMNASTALLLVLWTPGIAELIERINHPTIGDGGAWGFVILGVYFFTPIIILCARLEQRLFTSVSLRLFGKNKNDQPRTVPTIAVMFILNLLQMAAFLFALNVTAMFVDHLSGRHTPLFGMSGWHYLAG